MQAYGDERDLEAKKNSPRPTSILRPKRSSRLMRRKDPDAEDQTKVDEDHD